MGAGFLKKLAGNQFEVLNEALEAHGLNPPVQVMSETNIDI